MFSNEALALPYISARAELTCEVIATAMIHGLELNPTERTITVLVHLPDHVPDITLH